VVGTFTYNPAQIVLNLDERETCNMTRILYIKFIVVGEIFISGIPGIWQLGVSFIWNT